MKRYKHRSNRFSKLVDLPAAANEVAMDFFTNLLTEKSGGASATPAAAAASSPEPHHPSDLAEVSTKDLLRLTQKLQKSAKKWESRANGTKNRATFFFFSISRQPD